MPESPASSSGRRLLSPRHFSEPLFGSLSVGVISHRFHNINDYNSTTSVDNTMNVQTIPITEDQLELEQQRIDEYTDNEASLIQQNEPQHADDVLDRPKSSAGNIRKIIVAILFVTVIILIVIDSFTTQHIKTAFQSFLQWMETHQVAGVFAFMAVYFLATVLFIPGSILTLGSGFVFANAFGLGFGVVLATIAVFVGASLGAITAFLLGRYLLRQWVLQKLVRKYTVFEAIDKALEAKGFRIMALLRLSPIMPFNALNYIAGVTAISFVAYTSALVAIIPGSVFYVFLGATAGSLADSASSGGTSTTQIVVIVVGLVFGIFAIGLTSYYAKKELRKIMKDKEEVADEDVEQRASEESRQQAAQGLT